MLPAIALFLLYGGPHLFLGASAWSNTGSGRIRNHRPIIGIAGYGGRLLANIVSPRSASSSLTILSSGSASANDDDGGVECGVTPEIGSGSTAAAAVDSSSPSSSSLSRKPESGDVATFSLLRFVPAGGDVLEPLFDTIGTLQLVLDGGGYLPGLHRLLSSMEPGETVRGATIDAGYGGYDSSLSFKISASTIGESIDTSLLKVGTVLRMGNGMECRVTAQDDEEWTLDANHAMAGAAYDVDVRLERVEEGPKNWDYVEGGGRTNDDRYRVATFALGCFWGGELAYQRVPGVISTSVGYTQGQKENPTYEEVSSGQTGHTEAIQVIYDPNVASYKSLVQLGLDRLGENVFTLNQVGNDRGTQYRHGIYYHHDDQRKVAEELLGGYKSDGREVMTEVKEATIYYIAEDYHQQYLSKGGQSAKKGANDNIRCYG